MYITAHSRIRCEGELEKLGMLLLRMLYIFSWVCGNILLILGSEVSACKPCRCRCMFSRRGYFWRVHVWGLRWRRLPGIFLFQVELWTQDLWAQKVLWRIVGRKWRGMLWREGVQVFRTRGLIGQRLSISWGRCSAWWCIISSEVLVGGELHTLTCLWWCCPWCCMMTWCGVKRYWPGVGADPGDQ